MKTITKQQALELFGIDPDHFYVSKSFSKADVDDPLRGPREEPDDKKLSERLLECVNALVAASGVSPTHAARWLMHTDKGRALLATTKIEKENIPMVDIMKLHNPDSVIEFIKSSGASEHIISEVIMGHAKLNKQAGESDAQAFARVFPKFQTAYGVSKGYQKGMATLTPTAIGVDDVNDPAEAVLLLQQMAAKQGRAFEEVFADPANAKLASKIYTSAHRSSVSADYLES
jgi:hypothetical protein